jgi:hypothetical protein
MDDCTGHRKDEKRKGKSNEKEEKLGKCGEIIERK